MIWGESFGRNGISVMMSSVEHHRLKLHSKGKVISQIKHHDINQQKLSLLLVMIKPLSRKWERRDPGQRSWCFACVTCGPGA